MLTRLIAAALAVVVLVPLYPLNAQDWPARTITMVVPFPAGGPLDVVARILAQPMGDLLGQPGQCKCNQAHSRKTAPIGA
jgi:tripartite-type tricarboxylate transporter receptor subunit TctC